jgi:hypothetical protein
MPDVSTDVICLILKGRNVHETIMFSRRRAPVIVRCGATPPVEWRPEATYQSHRKQRTKAQQLASMSRSGTYQLWMLSQIVSSEAHKFRLL